jgi:hypothetical protein
MSEEEKSATTALHAIIEVLDRLDQDDRKRVLASVWSFFRSDVQADLTPVNSSAPIGPDVGNSLSGGRPPFSTHSVPTPKEFLAQKQPHTDVERIACLAFYLTHFRDTPSFRTLDLAKLNTEAAHPKFSNTAYAANNATNSGYLAPAAGGLRQISAAGEQFVQTLPDRDAARASMAKVRRRRASKRKK